ncbi:PD-(D/E)XK nuclease family protein [Endozoicomonas sp. ALB032]|uniref:PD-(D/E)XK nuclease family protein n=1 Tax=Endozoicomonas sp. ALB032 TaxID=3403082 RepID=UPI003BB493EB
MSGKNAAPLEIKNMTIPNIFRFATSELSQDAFICWLLCWADPALKNENAELHTCGLSLLDALFHKQGKTLPETINSVQVRKQDSNIDVLCIINGEYAVLIEDKVGTKQHSNQLERYKYEIANRHYDSNNIILIYLQTRDQGSYKAVKDNGYTPFLRQDFLTILNSYLGSNQILLDYRGHLQGIENRVKGYLNIGVTQWTGDQWIGFYIRLQEELGTGDWGYVANPSGGFFGYWWSAFCDEHSKQYLQLEQNKLCFKIEVYNKEERRQLRSQWHKQILSVSKNDSFRLTVTRPSRFGNGQYMTVCICEDWRITNSSGLLDFNQTIERLREAMKILKNAIMVAKGSIQIL